MKTSILRLSIGFSLILNSFNSFGQNNAKHFDNSFLELKEMIASEKDVDFERAVYLSESPYWNMVYSFEEFSTAIDRHVINIYNLARLNDKSSDMDFSVKVKSNGRFDMDKLMYTESEKVELYRNNLLNWAIFSYMTDTIVINGQEHLPLMYSSIDPFGLNDWRYAQVVNFFGSNDRSGNCFSLTALFKILSNRVNSKAVVCTAPQHIYIQHLDKDGDLYNVELATAGHPSDGQLQTLTYTTSDAIRSGIALRSYNNRQLVGLLLVNLAKSYERKTGNQSDDFILNCANLALELDSLNLSAMLLKQQVLDHKLYYYSIKKKMDFELLSSDKNSKEVLSNLEFNTAKLYRLGYRPMPVDMQRMILQGFSQSEESYLFYLKDKNPSPYTSIKPLKKEDSEYQSLSGGLFTEIWKKKEEEVFGHFVYNTTTSSLTRIENENYQKMIIDPVAFAYDFGARLYDSRLGKFISRDPLADQFPSWSPYTAMGNNPIYYIDVEGKYKYPADKAASYKKSYPLITKYLSTQVQQDVMNSTKILNGFASATGGNFTPDKVQEATTWGSGPEIRFVEAPGFLMGDKAHGYYEPYGDYIELNSKEAAAVEKILGSDASDEVKQEAFFNFYKTTLHETTHKGNTKDFERVNNEGEAGREFENAVWGSDSYDSYFDDSWTDPNVAKKIITESQSTEEGQKTLPTLPKKEK